MCPKSSWGSISGAWRSDDVREARQAPRSAAGRPHRRALHHRPPSRSFPAGGSRVYSNDSHQRARELLVLRQGQHQGQENDRGPGVYISTNASDCAMTSWPSPRPPDEASAHRTPSNIDQSPRSWTCSAIARTADAVEADLRGLIERLRASDTSWETTCPAWHWPRGGTRTIRTILKTAARRG